MADRYARVPYIPKFSGDVQWRIIDTESDNHDVVVIVDPNQIFDDPAGLAGEIARAMNTCKVMD